MNINDIKISLIAARSKNNVIGKDNELPWHLPSELKYFKKLTLNKPIIMGRKTYESIGKALPNRFNIVLSSDLNYELKDAIVCHKIPQAIRMARTIACYGNHPSDEIFIIGGSSIYESTIGYADIIYLTEVDIQVEGDSFFPDVSDFELIVEDAEEEAGIKYSKNVYKRK